MWSEVGGLSESVRTKGRVGRAESRPTLIIQLSGELGFW